MKRPGTFAFVVAAAAIAAAGARHLRGASVAHSIPGGIVMGDARIYDTLTGLALGSLFAGIAADVAATASAGARVLEIGCGPGPLSMRLARDHGLDVTGLDLDPAMIERARRNAARAGDVEPRQPSFVVGDVASLPFPDGSIDVVVSTLSMHHWEAPAAGLAEIGRVLRPGARALIWDFRPGVPLHPFAPRHAHAAGSMTHLARSPLRVTSEIPWRWPWRFSLIQRTELVRGDETIRPE